MPARRFAVLVPALLGGVLGFAAPTAIATAAAPVFSRPIVVVGTNKSTNWSGYNQGSLERGGELFSSVAGTWTVPTATQHKAGQAEFSSTWVGIGGGCVDAGCTVTDATLIQAGTEQDVSKGGQASYSAWYELIPAPSITISNFPVHAGDSITVTIGEVVAGSNVWTIVVKDATSGKTFTTTLPYSSTHATAEWIEETPLIIGTGAGFSALPKLSTVHFDLGKVNGSGPGLKPSEEIQLVDSTGKALATPSGPDPDTDGFNDCSYSGSCAAPSGS